MKSIELNNQEFQVLQAEIGDILPSKDLTYGEKFKALDVLTEIQPKLESFAKLQADLFKEYGTPNEDGKTVKLETEEGVAKYTDLLKVTSELQYDESFVDAVLNIKSNKVPLVLYKISKNKD